MHLNLKRYQIFYGWWIVIACFLIAVYTGGVIFFGFTAAFEPIAAEFGWSYAQVSIAASLRGMEMGLLAPLVGWLVDRWGPRRLMFAGSIFIGLGYMLLSRVNSIGIFYVAFVLIAIGTSNFTSTVKMTAVVNWFRKRVGIATGIVQSGFAVGGLFVPLVALLIDTVGWRTAMVIFSLIIWVIGLPLSLIVRHKPEQYGYLPDGEVNSSVALAKDLAPLPGAEVSIGVGQALKSRTFWHIAVAFICNTMVISAIMTHVMPYLSSIGITRSLSSLLASALPMVSISGRLFSGWLGDRLGRKRIAVVDFALMSLGLLFFSYLGVETIWLAVPFLIFYGLGWGGNSTIKITLMREYFGRAQFGTIYGFMVGLWMVGHMIGAPLAGWVYDTWSSYRGIWLVFTALNVAAIGILLTIPPLSNTNQMAGKPKA